MTPTIEGLVEQVSHRFGAPDGAMVQRAYEVAAHAHRHQKRKSGEPYVVHCLATADIIANLQMPPTFIMAGLLHDTVEDTDLTLADIKAEFGDEVAELVDGVTKLNLIAETTGTRKRNLGHIETESLRKMFLAMTEHPGVIFVKLADRLHNMRTLHALPRHKQISIARETQEIFAPLSSRLGMWQFKWELEDLCLRYLEPETYYDLVVRLNERREDRLRSIDNAIAKVTAALEEMGLEKPKVTGRSKHLYSIFKKMKRKERDLDHIFDVRALRIIVKNKAECYAALGVVHSLWRPIPTEFDDYIGNPKENNYRSLHTAVYTEEGKALEVQIRDEEMHEFAERGVAAHWRYKEQARTSNDSFLDSRLKRMRQLFDLEGLREDDADEFMDSMKSDVLPDRVFVFTPRGDIKELPTGSTPIDFAYLVHTDIGNRCRGARVNGKMVPLTYTLAYGDQVEIITAKNASPSRDWLNPYSGHVKTKGALAKIRAWFRRLDREDNIREGREMVEKELRRLGVQIPLERLATKSGHSNLSDFLALVGTGDLSAHTLAVKELEARRAEESKVQSQSLEAEIAALPRRDVPTTKIDELNGMQVRMAGCCSPVHGDDIVGYVTRTSGITVHQRSCQHALREPERVVEVAWGEHPANTFDANVKILAIDRDGLLRDIFDVVANEKVNMRAVSATTDRRDNAAVITAILEVRDVQQLSRILARIGKLPNVYEVHRASG